MVTNISSSDILKLFNIITKKDKIDIYTLNLEGYDEYIYDYRYIDNQGMKLNLYNFVPYSESLKSIKSIIKQNLNGEELKEVEIQNYTSDLLLLPNFIGRSYDEVENFCQNHNIKLNTNDVVSHNSNDYEGKVVNQDITYAVDVDYIKELSVDVVSKIEKIDTNINCSKEEYKSDERCLLPNFIDEDYSVFNEWLKKNKYSFRVDIKKLGKKDKGYDKKKIGKIVFQNYTDISIYDIIGKTLKISYIEK